jgi:hypothetical protein
MRKFLLPLVCCVVSIANAQTFGWWADHVKWDGVSHWSKYIITQPAYLGPNALPVPRIGNGNIDSISSISLTGNLHFSKGDNTQNLTLYGNYFLVKGLISFDVSWVPYEYYTMSHEMKEKRNVFSHFYYDRHATGDIHLNTNIRLLKKWEKQVQLALRLGYRFPTSSGLGMARFTDAPGYYFDLSFGKPFHSTNLKWVGMMGFYSWQLISDTHRQNDAFLFGSGLEWNTKTLRLQSYVAGYIGYMNNGGDKPVVFRTSLEKKLKRTSLLAGFQQGLHDFRYTSVEMGLKYRFSK